LIKYLIDWRLQKSVCIFFSFLRFFVGFLGLSFDKACLIFLSILTKKPGESLMLITFKSKAAAEVIMYKEHARRILELLGKDVNRGVITAEESGRAIAVIEAAVAESRAHPITEEVARDVSAHHNDRGDDNDHEKAEIVSFSARVFPLLEMLRAAHQMQREVMWGV
jgi:Domain of unknown function (DUF1840)